MRQDQAAGRATARLMAGASPPAARPRRGHDQVDAVRRTGSRARSRPDVKSSAGCRCAWRSARCAEATGSISVAMTEPFESCAAAGHGCRAARDRGCAAAPWRGISSQQAQAACVVLVTPRPEGGRRRRARRVRCGAVFGRIGVPRIRNRPTSCGQLRWFFRLQSRCSSRSTHSRRRTPDRHGRQRQAPPRAGAWQAAVEQRFEGPGFRFVAGAHPGHRQRRVEQRLGGVDQPPGAGNPDQPQIRRIRGQRAAGPPEVRQLAASQSSRFSR